MNRNPNISIIFYQHLIRTRFLRLYKLFYYSRKNIEELVNFAKHRDTETQSEIGASVISNVIHVVDLLSSLQISPSIALTSLGIMSLSKFLNPVLKHKVICFFSYLFFKLAWSTYIIFNPKFIYLDQRVNANAVAVWSTREETTFRKEIVLELFKISET